MAFIPSRSKRHITDPGKLKINLNAMMDMFTIILLFLLKVYSTEGHLVNPSEDLTLPNSSIEKVSEVSLDLAISKDWLLLNDKPVMRVQDLLASDQIIIPALQNELQKYADGAEKMQERYGRRFSGSITIQGDKELPYRALVKVMATCGRSKYPNMRFLVYQNES